MEETTRLDLVNIYWFAFKTSFGWRNSSGIRMTSIEKIHSYLKNKMPLKV
jgi:hypothetical protein